MEFRGIKKVNQHNSAYAPTTFTPVYPNVFRERETSNMKKVNQWSISVFITIFVFINLSSMLALVVQLLLKDFQAFLSLAWSLAYFTFFQITSVYLISCLPKWTSGKTTTNLEGFIFTRPSTIFLSYQMIKPFKFFMLQAFPHTLQFQSSPTFLCRNPILRPNITHPSKHPCIIQALFQVSLVSKYWMLLFLFSRKKYPSSQIYYF